MILERRRDKSVRQTLPMPKAHQGVPEGHVNSKGSYAVVKETPGRAIDHMCVSPIPRRRTAAVQSLISHCIIEKFLVWYSPRSLYRDPTDSLASLEFFVFKYVCESLIRTHCTGERVGTSQMRHSGKRTSLL